MPDPTGALCVVGGALVLGALLGNLHAPHPKDCLWCRPVLRAVLVGAGVFAVYAFLMRRTSVKHD